MFRFTPLVRNLLVLNIAVAFIDMLLLNNEAFKIAGLYSFSSSEFLPFQLLTYMFFHSPLNIEPFHLIGNMIALAVFGPWLENLWGSNRFFIFYIAAGLGAGAINSGITTYQSARHYQDVMEYKAEQTPQKFVEYLGKHVYKYIDRYGSERPNPNDGGVRFANYCIQLERVFSEHPDREDVKAEVFKNVEGFYLSSINRPVVGASGAVFGILIAVFLLFPNVKIFLLFPPIPLQVKYLVGFYILYELYIGLGGQGDFDNVAHYAHLGGAVVGFILVKIWGIKPPK